MAKLNQSGFSAFLANIPKNVNVFLGFGNDDGLIFESSQNVAKKINPDLNDPFSVEYITLDQIKENPNILYMAATSTSLMGGRKLIIVKEATDAITAPLKEVLHLDLDTFIVLFGIGLNKKSTLVQTVENSDKGMALGCYADDINALRDLITKILQSNNITYDNETMNFLTSKLGADRKMTLSEMEKLVTYLGDEKTLTLEDAGKIIDDASAVSFENLTDGIYARNPRLLCNSLQKLLKEGETEIGVIRIVASFIKKYIPVYKAVADGQNMMSAMSYIKPKPNYKQEAKIKASFKNWNYSSLNRVMEILLEAEIGCKTTNYPVTDICERALLQIINLKN